jgi:molecular chaperone GrpE
MDADDPEFDAIAAAKELDDLLGEDYTSPAEAEIADLKAQLERAKERVGEEIEAASKRIAAASDKELAQRTRKLLAGFLEVVDDLDRGIAAAHQHAESRDVVAGLELIRRSMLTRLGQFGVTHAPALGEVFDPNRHDAIAVVPVADPAQAGRVIDVMREGYLIGDDTLRPASVAVGKR